MSVNSVRDEAPLLTWRDLSPPERLYVDRTRRGEDYHAAARRHGVTERTYEHWEWGIGTNCPVLKTHRKALTTGEIFVALRRRHSYSQAALAQMIGRSRQWVNALECGRDERADAQVLIDFWRAEAMRSSKGGAVSRAIAAEWRAEKLRAGYRGLSAQEAEARRARGG